MHQHIKQIKNTWKVIWSTCEKAKEKVKETEWDSHIWPNICAGHVHWCRSTGGQGFWWAKNRSSPQSCIVMKSDLDKLIVCCCCGTYRCTYQGGSWCIWFMSLKQTAECSLLNVMNHLQSLIQAKRVSSFLLGMIERVLMKIPQHYTHLDNDSYQAIMLPWDFIWYHWQCFLWANKMTFCGQSSFQTLVTTWINYGKTSSILNYFQLVSLSLYLGLYVVSKHIYRWFKHPWRCQALQKVSFSNGSSLHSTLTALN